MTPDGGTPHSRDWNTSPHKVRLTMLTAPEFRYQVMRKGRNHGPGMLISAHLAGEITTDTLGEVIQDVWSMAEYPEKHLDSDTWRELFQEVRHSFRDQLPTAPLTLYRGSIPDRKFGFSWTNDLAVAQWFAQRHRHSHSPPTYVYQIECPPHLVLCRIADGRPGEAEYVVDTDWLADDDLSCIATFTTPFITTAKETE